MRIAIWHSGANVTALDQMSCYFQSSHTNYHASHFAVIRVVGNVEQSCPKREASAACVALIKFRSRQS